MPEKRLFVTVGTTEFDQLIKSVTSADVCQVLRRLGYSRVLLQTGRGQFQPEPTRLSDHSPAVQSYTFKDSIADDIAAADLVICHAGAGSVLETLTAGKSTLVVINDELMDNHQEELAQQLQLLQHLYYCTCSTLRQTLEKVDFTTLQPYTPGDPAFLMVHLQSLLSAPASVSQTRVFACHACWISVIAAVYMWTPLGAFLLLFLLLCVGGFIFCGNIANCSKE
ncbi:hypothetical protein ACOMHN_024483 [Nucella lapillus]